MSIRGICVPNTGVKPFLADCVVILCVILCLTVTFGCSKSKENTTVVGLKEQVQNEKKRVELLEKDNEIIRSRSENDYKISEEKHKEEITNLRELHRVEVAQLKGQNASLQMELGAVTREKITLDEIINQQPSIEAGNQVRSSATSMILLFIIALMFVAIVILGFKYQAVVAGRQQLIMQATGNIRRLSNE